MWTVKGRADYQKRFFFKKNTEDWLRGVAVDDRGLLRSVVEVRAATHTTRHRHTHTQTHTHAHAHAHAHTHTQVRAATSREEEREVNSKVTRVMKQLHGALARKQV